MTDLNHRRTNRPPVNERYSSGDRVDPLVFTSGQSWSDYRNGYARFGKAKTVSVIRTGRTDYLDKSMHGWGRKSLLADRLIGAGIGNDFSNGHRGMARAVKGAKKFVRTRVRFHENQATQALAHQDHDDASP